MVLIVPCLYIYKSMRIQKSYKNYVLNKHLYKSVSNRCKIRLPYVEDCYNFRIMARTVKSSTTTHIVKYNFGYKLSTVLWLTHWFGVPWYWINVFAIQLITAPWWTNATIGTDTPSLSYDASKLHLLDNVLIIWNANVRYSVFTTRSIKQDFMPCSSDFEFSLLSNLG